MSHNLTMKDFAVFSYRKIMKIIAQVYAAQFTRLFQVKENVIAIFIDFDSEITTVS